MNTHITNIPYNSQSNFRCSKYFLSRIFMDPPLTMYVPTMITSHHHQVDTNCIKLLSNEIQSSHRGSKPYVSISGAAASSAKIQRCFHYGRGWISFSKHMAQHLLKSICLFFISFLCQHLRPLETIRILPFHHPNSSLGSKPFIAGFATSPRAFNSEGWEKHLFGSC